MRRYCRRISLDFISSFYVVDLEVDSPSSPQFEDQQDSQWLATNPGLNFLWETKIMQMPP